MMEMKSQQAQKDLQQWFPDFSEIALSEILQLTSSHSKNRYYMGAEKKSPIKGGAGGLPLPKEQALNDTKSSIYKY